MKYLVSWTTRSGASAADNEAAVDRVLEVFSKWSPPPGQTFHQFLGRLDSRGGYAVVETDSADALADGPAKFGPYFDYEIVPVVDITDTVRHVSQGAEFRKAAT